MATVFLSSFYIEFQNIFTFANKYFFFPLSSVAKIKKMASGFLCHFLVDGTVTNPDTILPVIDAKGKA